jgi:ectoine hydroxylase-related dioxygenase (phytanoyl-CoA dioxygenase family)
MNGNVMREITREEIETYQRDGVVLLKNQFSLEWIDLLRDLAEEDMNTPGKLKHELAEASDAGRFFVNTFLWHRSSEFKRFVFESPARKIVSALMKASKVNIVFDQLLIKEPNTKTRTHWHHDLTYWPISGDGVCSLWLALDEVAAETGAVEYIRGSHRWGVRYRPTAFRPEIEYGDDLPEAPDVEAAREQYDIVQYELEPGDCTIHHGLTLHGAPGNQTPSRRRRAHVTRWAGDDVVYHPRANIQPMLFDPDIPPGAPLDSELWPVVWRAEALQESKDA